MVITGYKYTNEQEAIDARETCDAYYGIPVNPDDVTQNWCDYQISELDNPIFWFIIFDESLRVVLGDPETFEVTTPPFPPTE
jgi:hypothetical protein